MLDDRLCNIMTLYDLQQLELDMATELKINGWRMTASKAGLKLIDASKRVI